MTEPIAGDQEMPAAGSQVANKRPPQTQDSTVTKAELGEPIGSQIEELSGEPPSKRARVAHPGETTPSLQTERRKGVAPVKQEFLVHIAEKRAADAPPASEINDDDAEASKHIDQDQSTKASNREKKRGQNKARTFGKSKDERGLCSSVAIYSEFSAKECRFGDKCRFEHDLRKYLSDYKREDLTTFGGKCPVFQARGKCSNGWKCRFVGSHMSERETEDGKQELVLLENPSPTGGREFETEDDDIGIVNSVSIQTKIDLSKRKFDDSKAEKYANWLDKLGKSTSNLQKKSEREDNDTEAEAKEDLRAQYKEAPFLPSEKRRIYFGPETPVLAPLTTQGNLPFRRLCVELGAQLTYSEMAMATPIVQGHKSEWALMKAHESEIAPPRFTPKPGKFVVENYDHSKDIKFGAQIAANKPFFATKAVQAMTTFLPNLRLIDLNCGCPIDLVFKAGAGSALLDANAKLDKIIRGMNAVSGEVPITAKIRMGTKDNKPTALKTIDRLVYGSPYEDALWDEPCGVAAITLHGRSRQQRYTKSANWEYISECAALINEHRKHGDTLSDTIKEADSRYNPANGQIYFLGNGDCYSHVDYFDHVQNAGVDSIMVARGALIKPWIFEEIGKGQYLDKSATERLAYVEKYARYGLETWGSDEMGIGTTRRFLLEWLSFAYRYVPEGILEHLPPNIQDRPPAWKGRNDLETLMGSDNYLDWIKISEMFLGPAHKDFKFEPKHKSNSYEVEAEG